ncbi:uncharacterized protein LOC144456489 [Phascolarctos cinereus]
MSHLSRIKKTPALDQKVTYVEETFETGYVKKATSKISRKCVSMAEHRPVITSATATPVTSNAQANTFNVKGTTSLKIKSNKEPSVTDQPRISSPNEEHSRTGANKISLKPGGVSVDVQAAPGTVTPNYINEPGGMKKVIRTPEGKTKTEDLTGLRVPMATPTSMAAELKVDKENKVAESAVDDANSVQENLGTTPKETEIQKKLMRTAEQQTEAEDLPKQLMKTPKLKCGSVEHLTTVVKRPMRTPKDKLEVGEEEVGGNERSMMSSPKEKSNQNMNIRPPLRQKGPSEDLVGLKYNRNQPAHIQKKNTEEQACLKELRMTIPKQIQN